MENGIVFAREQCVHAHARPGRQLFEAVAHQPVRDKDFTLPIGQLIQSRIDLLR